MKTLLVLVALAATATAAPATLNDHELLPKKGVTFQANSLGTVKREKKSPSDIAEPTEVVEDINQPLEFSPETSARTIFMKKKPIIVKNNLGYHRLYRDSDEEQADSQEKCTKEVTVKLCHAGNEAKLKQDAKGSVASTVNEHKSDNEMEKSIKLAKEAVENLQRDLINMKQGSSAKSSQWKNTDPAADSEIEADLEAARQALEQIHQSFGNLESMNLHSTTLKDAEALEDAHKQLAETDDERMAKWKEAMSTIQKNIDIARDIEESFMLEKSAPLLSSDSFIKADNPELALVEPVHFGGINEKPGMFSVSAFKPKEMNLEINNEEKFRNGMMNLDIPIQKSNEDHQKSADLTLTNKISNFEKDSTNEEPKESIISEVIPTSDTMMLNDDSQMMLDGQKPLTVFDKEAMEHVDEKQRAAEETPEESNVEDTKSTMVEEKSADISLPIKGTKVVDTTNLMKNSENNIIKNSEDTIMKNSEDNLTNDSKTDVQKNTEENIMKNTEENTMKNVADPLMKNVEELNEKKDFSEMGVKKFNMDLPKSVDHEVRFDQVLSSELSTQSKSADSQITATETKATDMLESPSENSETVMTIKAANPDLLKVGGNIISTVESSVSHTVENIPVANLENTPKSVNNVDVNVPAESTNQMHFKTAPNNLARTDLNPMTHEKTLNMENGEQPTVPMHMKDMAEKSVQDRHSMLQWKNHMGRGAYGIYGPATSGIGGAPLGSGAVGLFPNAKVGGCAIPLLLSCSPSVVSGSLAKAHPPAYAAAPAYRMGDNFHKFHKKRDITKILVKGKRSPTQVIQRIPLSKKY